MDREQRIQLLRRGVGESRSFLGIPREVAPLPQPEKFDWWGNIVDFYGMDKIGEFFSNMFRREKFSDRPTTIDSRYGAENMRMIKRILDE